VRAKAIIPREVTHRDVDEAVTHYVEHASGNVALGFTDALELIDRYPGIPRLPLVIQSVAYAMLSADFGNRHTRFTFTENGHNLAFRKLRLPHP
jgi:hypothetical protein